MNTVKVPVKIVLKVTGGVIEAVYADQPIEVLLVSTDAEDIADEFQEGMFTAQEGGPASIISKDIVVDDEADALIQHYFAQHAKR